MISLARCIFFSVSRKDKIERESQLNSLYDSKKKKSTCKMAETLSPFHHIKTRGVFAL
jgi:hypothetical protein